MLDGRSSKGYGERVSGYGQFNAGRAAGRREGFEMAERIGRLVALVAGGIETRGAIYEAMRPWLSEEQTKKAIRFALEHGLLEADGRSTLALPSTTAGEADMAPAQVEYRLARAIMDGEEPSVELLEACERYSIDVPAMAARLGAQIP